MNVQNATELMEQLGAGFESLQHEYRRLFGQNETLERKLQIARDQYNELAQLYGKGRSSTPPLSLPSSTKPANANPPDLISFNDAITKRASGDTAESIRLAGAALETFRRNSTNNGVRIWSGPSADKPEAPSSSVMPSISESPLEQDFTVQGVPSKLGCPFASMANKKLSSHAASIVSRYNQRSSMNNGSVTGNRSTTGSIISRINGRESLANRRESGRTNGLPDPIKAEICGLSDHSNAAEMRSGLPEPPIIVADDDVKQDEGGVCPIRFLDQHSPEEVATYFEKHKHELPRSHEICVKRYQSNEESIRELDAKYGNLVSMIQGLGQKHQPMLPEEPQEDDENDQDDSDKEKIKQWAHSVSGLAAEMNGEEGEEERTPHFDRPMRDVRVGESPSRPWGYNVPLEYLERRNSVASSKAGIPPSKQPGLNKTGDAHRDPVSSKVHNEQKPTGKCPFGFDQKGPGMRSLDNDEAAATSAEKMRDASKLQQGQLPQRHAESAQQPRPGVSEKLHGFKGAHERPQIVISGPVFIGYNAIEAAKFLKETGLGGPQ